jgi:hypothetical protein
MIWLGGVSHDGRLRSLGAPPLLGNGRLEE